MLKMMRLIMLVAALVAAGLTGGCAATIVAAGTTEEDIIHRGTTKAELTEKLGAPLRVEALDDPGNEATDKGYYRFLGILKKQGDIGNALAGSLMSFGIAELWMPPWR